VGEGIEGDKEKMEGGQQLPDGSRLALEGRE
jgi:hypothetical protein